MNSWKRKAAYVCTIAFAAAISWSLAADSQSSKSQVNLSPASWGEGEADRWANLDNAYGSINPSVNPFVRLQPTLATGKQGAIAGTTGPAAVHAGFLALKAGGSAIDAAVTTALTQITLAGGSWVSYAGLMGMVYYEAETGKVYEMNACFGIPLDEDDPTTIPVAYGAGTIEPSGRTALVPGFLAGVESAHKRFGNLPFETLFQPAIYYAENGFEVDPMLNAFLAKRKDVLARLPETKQVFFKDDGEIYSTGDLFKQPRLAATLRNVATKGVEAYIYNGEWAEQFVAAVQAEGGEITMEDMRHYEVLWNDPLHTTFAGYDVYTSNLPSYGGPITALGLNLIEEAGMLDRPHYAESAKSLEDWIKIDQGSRMGMLLFYAPVYETLLGNMGLADFNPEHLADKNVAKKMWELLEEGKLPLDQGGGAGSHSDAIAVVDADGNIAVLTHSINTETWGATGLNVGGISIPDAAGYQQAPMKVAGPGNRLPSPLNSVIVLKDGKPVTCGSSIGAGLHSKTLSYLVNTLGFKMNPRESIDAPALDFGSVVSKSQFSAELIEEAEADGVNMTLGEGRGARGYYAGLRFNPESGNWEAAASTDVPGYSAGY